MNVTIEIMLEPLKEAHKALIDYTQAVRNLLNEIAKKTCSNEYFINAISVESMHYIRKYDQAGPWAEMLDTNNKINWI